MFIICDDIIMYQDSIFFIDVVNYDCYYTDNNNNLIFYWSIVNMKDFIIGI